MHHTMRCGVYLTTIQIAALTVVYAVVYYMIRLLCVSACVSAIVLEFVQ